MGNALLNGVLESRSRLFVKTRMIFILKKSSSVLWSVLTPIIILQEARDFFGKSFCRFWKRMEWFWSGFPVWKMNIQEEPKSIFSIGLEMRVICLKVQSNGKNSSAEAIGSSRWKPGKWNDFARRGTIGLRQIINYLSATGSTLKTSLNHILVLWAFISGWKRHCDANPLLLTLCCKASGQ